MEAGDADAVFTMGASYMYGDDDTQQDIQKALELFLRAVQLGSIEAHNKIGMLYSDGNYLLKDPKKSIYHFQQGAVKGCEYARFHIGLEEFKMGNIDRAIKHWVIGASIGHKSSLDNVEVGFTRGHATKAQYEKAMRGYQFYLDEAKTETRDKVRLPIQMDEASKMREYEKNRTR